MKATLLIRIIERNPTLTVERLLTRAGQSGIYLLMHNFEIYHFTEHFKGYDQLHFTYYLHRRGYTGRDIAKMLYVSEKVVSQRLTKVSTDKERYDLQLIEKML